MACVHLRHLAIGLVHLNLSNTKMGSKGCKALAKIIKLPGKDDFKKSRLLTLDISHNSIGRDGLNKLFHKMRQHDSIKSLNVAYNDLIIGEKLISLVEFLSINKSCIVLNLSGSSLRPGDMVFLGQGLARNVCLQKLVLVDNSF